MSIRSDRPKVGYAVVRSSAPDELRPDGAHPGQGAPNPTSSLKLIASHQKKPIWRNGREPGIFARIEGWWLLQLVSLLLAGGSLVATVLILRRYDGAPQPDWQLISLNTLISWLSTVARVCLLLPVEESIGTLKWVWFSQDKRPLSHIRSFDAASRGLWGSIQVIWIQKAIHFASLGCLATILAIGYEPFVQNLVHYHAQAVADGTSPAVLANTFNYTAVLNQVQGAGQLLNVDPVLKANVYNSILNPDSAQVWATPRFICPTGNCTWTDVSSFLVQPTCTDLTSAITSECPPNGTLCHKSVPDGPSLKYTKPEYLTGTFEGMKVVSTEIDNRLTFDPQPMPQIRYIMDLDSPRTFTASGFTDLERTNDSFAAASCSLEVCIQRLDVSIRNSVYSEQQKSLQCKGLYPAQDDWYDSQGGYTMVNPNKNEDTRHDFVITGIAFTAIKDLLHQIFQGSIVLGVQQTAYLQIGSDDTSDSYAYANTDILQALWYGNISGRGQEEDRLIAAINNTAKALTKSLRDSTLVALGDNLDPAAAQEGPIRDSLAFGKVFHTSTYVRIDWVWLSLPVFVWILSVLTWVGTAWKRRRANVPDWDNNPLPLLFLYRPDHNQKPFEQEGLTSSHYDALADSLDARLHVTKSTAYLL